MGKKIKKDEEMVDVLLPPDFKLSGVVKSRQQAYIDEDWIGTFNLWIIRQNPEPAILYQQRSFRKSWAPGLLDIAVAGHYQAGETLIDGLREAEEELNVFYDPKDMLSLGKKLYVDRKAGGHIINNVVDIYMIEDDSPLESYKLQKEEVEAICILPMRELLRVHQDSEYHFTAKALTNMGKRINLTVTKTSFPYNYDNYHYKMAILANRYFNGDKALLY